MIQEPLGNEYQEHAREVLRQSEMQLQSQLQLALAADQRAVTFASFIIPTTSALFAFALTTKDPALQWGSVVVVVLLVVAAGISLYTARPVRFQVPGTNASDWWDDIRAVPLAESIRQASVHCDCYISENEQILDSNGSLTRWAFASATLAPALGIIVAGVIRSS